MLADVILAAAELQVAGEDAGLDPDDVFFVLNRVAPSLEPRQAGLEGHPTPTLFALRDLRKDVDLAMALYGSSASQTPLTRWSREQVDAAAAATPDLDISAVAQLYRRGPRGRFDGGPVGRPRSVNAMTASMAVRSSTHTAVGVRVGEAPDNGPSSASSRSGPS